jgi:hypothetical protein
VNDITGLPVEMCDPLGKLNSIWNCGREEDVVGLLWEKDDGLFPNNPTLLVPHVMDLIENDPTHFTHDFRTSV